MKHPWVILFDIDGTLLTVNQDFNRPLIRSVVDQLGINYDGVETDRFSGRTDHDIMNSFLQNHNYDQNLYSQLKSVYIEKLTSEITENHILRHSHVDEAVQYFSQDGFIPGLLTGNYPRAAVAKLKAANIELDYKIGAFGDYHEDRNMLPKLAISKTEEILGIQADPQNFIVIGDTPKDIECAKYSGMRSVAVTTGMFNNEQLAAHDPDMILDTLENPDIWFKELVGEAA